MTDAPAPAPHVVALDDDPAIRELISEYLSQNDLRTLPLGIARFQEEYVTTYSELMAVATIGMIPLVVMFFLFQRAFVQGIVMSGLKE